MKDLGMMLDTSSEKGNGSIRVDLVLLMRDAKQWRNDG